MENRQCGGGDCGSGDSGAAASCPHSLLRFLPSQYILLSRYRSQLSLAQHTLLNCTRPGQISRAYAPQPGHGGTAARNTLLHYFSPSPSPGLVCPCAYASACLHLRFCAHVRVHVGLLIFSRSLACWWRGTAAAAAAGSRPIMRLIWIPICTNGGAFFLVYRHVAKIVICDIRENEHESSADCR
jgi:hypothetical protein